MLLLRLCLSVLLSRVVAWDAEGDCSYNDCCGWDAPGCGFCGTAYGESAAKWFDSPLASMMNNIIYNDNRRNGVLVRTPDFETGQTWTATSLINASMKPANPSYKSQPSKSSGNPQCPSETYQCSDPSSGYINWCSGADPKLWEYLDVSLAYARRLNLNDDLPAYYTGGDGNGQVTVSACYPTDANAVDKRGDYSIQKGYNTEGGGNIGRGCHPMQFYACANDKCITLNQINCKCNYDEVAGRDFGPQLAASFSDCAANPFDDNICHVEQRNWGGGQCFLYKEDRQPVFGVADYPSCWYNPSDSYSFDHMVDAMNSIWEYRDSLYNWHLPVKDTWNGIESTYWGWNECPASYNWGTDSIDKNLWLADAYVLVMPPVNRNDYPSDKPYNWSLCDMSEAAINQLLRDLQYVHSQGWGRIPVVIMEQISGIEADWCWLWDDNKCGDGYQKKFFSQNYWFGDGSCLMIADDNEVYFWNADPNTNPNGSQGAQNDKKYCCEMNGNWDWGCWGGFGAAEPSSKKKKGGKKSKGSKKKKGKKGSKGSKKKDNIFD